MLDAFARVAIDLMEVDVGLGFGGDEELDAKGNEGDLDLTAPVGTSYGGASGPDLPTL